MKSGIEKICMAGKFSYNKHYPEKHTHAVEELKIQNLQVAFDTKHFVESLDFKIGLFVFCIISNFTSITTKNTAFLILPSVKLYVQFDTLTMFSHPDNILSYYHNASCYTQSFYIPTQLHCSLSLIIPQLDYSNFHLYFCITY